MTHMKLKVLFLTNLPSPYMVDFLNELGKLCELKVIFERNTSSERNDSWKSYKINNFSSIILNGIKVGVDMAFCPQILTYIKKGKFNYIIVSNPTTPTGIISILYMKMRKIDFILESEGGFPKIGNGLKESFKKLLMKNAFLYFSTRAEKDEYFLKYGASVDKLVKYPFTSFYKSEILNAVLSEREKRELRSKLGISSEKVAVAVGRFIPLKKYDKLLEAWFSVNKDFSLYLIGGGEELNSYKEFVSKKEMKNVFFVDFLPKKELWSYYKAADLFIHPTSTDVWGLVICEAMANALPVITTDMCIAGRELVENDINGYIVPVGNNEELLNRINQILSNNDMIIRMSENSLQRVQWYTYENMARVHIDVLSSINIKEN